MSIAWSKKGAIFSAGILTLGLLFYVLLFVIEKPLAIAVDGQVIQTRALFTRTVGQVLDQNQIKLEGQDVVTPSADTRVSKDLQITVTRAFAVKVIADGTSREIYTIPVTAEEAVTLAGITLGEKDFLKPEPGEMVVPQQAIEVIRVTEKVTSEDQEMPYQVEKTTDPTLEKGLTRTLVSGKNGLTRNTLRVTYYNGQEAKRELLKMETLSQPRNKVVAMGNITSVSRGGQRLDFSEARYMQASAYTYTGRNTSGGEKPAVGMVAVDPNVIPLGTKLYVEGYGYAWAADTGGSIKGDRIDLFMEERAQCVNWGRKTVKVYILS
ncbi:MAG: 3D domain-containing protein [Syntrophomonadaceae bacterium]